MVMTTMLTQSAHAPPSRNPAPLLPTPITSVAPVPPLFSSSSARRRFPLSSLTRAKTDNSASAAPKYPSPGPPSDDGPVFVGQQDVPLEGVIQFERPGQTSRLWKWGRVALLAGGDVLALLIFSAIGRFSHGFAVLDLDTLRTADPFVAGWLLGAYFLEGYGDEGRGEKGFSSAVISAMKSWALGVPLGLSIRALLTGHVPQYNFIIVTVGSTAVLLIGWRTLLSSILPYDKSRTNDDYRRGSPFELFECGCDALLNFPSTGMSSDSFPDRVSGMAPSDLIFGSSQDSPIPLRIAEGLRRSSMVSISQSGSHQQHLLMENHGICPGSMYGLAQDPFCFGF